MKQFRSSLVLILSAATGGAAALPSAHAELFDLKAPRGESRVDFVSPGKVTEACIVPKGFPGVEYDQKDLEKIAKLCTMGFYGVSGPNQEIITATCPKLSSTNPGTEIEEVPQGMTSAQYVAKECVKEDRSGKKIGKFKQSISCSYTPAILAYYHVAQALGGSIEVPETVIRTMDIDEHKKITAMGVANTKSGDTINATWKSWKAAEADPKNYSKRDRVFSTDFEQIYGALSKNPTGEEKYSEINAGLNGFKKSDGWAKVKSSDPVTKLFKKDISSAPKFIQMKDISNFLVIDYIMAQQDRFGNIHARDLVYSFDGHDVKKRKPKASEPIQAGEVAVKELLLKDNDCGLRQSDNVVKNEKFLQAIRHMAPKNYKKLLEFAAAVKTPEVQQYLRTEMLMTSDDVKVIATNAAEAVKILQAACKSGSLKLDLDFEAFLRGEDLSQQDCG